MEAPVKTLKIQRKVRAGKILWWDEGVQSGLHPVPGSSFRLRQPKVGKPCLISIREKAQLLTKKEEPGHTLGWLLMRHWEDESGSLLSRWLSTFWRRKGSCLGWGTRD
jgi:hypothetical protein